MASKPANSHSVQRRWLALSYGFFILLLVLGSFFWRFYGTRHQLTNHHEMLIPVQEPLAHEGDRTVEVGLLVDNTYNFEPDKKTFDANGWVWLKWSPEIEARLKARRLNVEQLFYFYNQVSDWDLQITSVTESAQKLADGRYYQRFRFAGHFYANELDFRKYPFQVVRLPMAFELNPEKLLEKGEEFNLVLDQTNSGVGAYIDLGGYLTTGYSFRNFLHRYESVMGESEEMANHHQVPQARMEIAYEKALVATVLKLLLPLVTVMAVALFSPAISSSGWDVRVGIPPTALLTLIFLQQTYQNWLPELPYITFLDTVYNLCYFANLSLFGLFLWGTNEYSLASEAEKPQVVERIDRVDRYFQAILFVLLILGISANWLFIADSFD